MNQKVIFSVVLVGLVVALVGMKAMFLPTTTNNFNEVDVIAMVDIWRAKTAFAKGELLSKDKLEHITMPKDEALSSGFSGEQNLPFNQQGIVSQRVEIGAEIKANNVVLPGDPRYISLVLPSNKLAYPLTINKKQLLANALTVGDFVDVFTLNSPDVNTLDDGFGSHRNLAITMLLSHIKLLSVPVLNTEIETEGATENVVNADTVDVLIELNKEEAMTLALAEKITLVDVMPFTEGPHPLSIGTERLIEAIKEERRESVREIRGMNDSLEQSMYR